MLKVNEIFGPTIQGEGPHAGQHCLFIRLANCNLTCKWCDTSYTWAFTNTKASKHQSGRRYDKAKEIQEMSVSEIWLELKALYPNPTRIVISGGEPLLQANELTDLAQCLESFYDIDVETAGTLSARGFGAYVTTFVVSPKLTGSGNSLSARRRPVALLEFANMWRHKTWWKFVITSDIDLKEVDELVSDYEIPRDRVMLMPEGTTSHAVLSGGKNLINAALERGYGLSLREHVLLWEDERKR